MPTKSTDKFLARAVTEGQEPTVEGYDGPLNGEVYAIRSGDSVFGIAGADGQAEAARKQAEIERQAAETQRAEQQSANNAAQQQNDEAQQENDSKQDLNDQSQAANNEQQLANNKAAQGVYAVVLGDGEYDPETRKPTIDGEVGKIYLVPTGDGLTNATWMWVDGAWAGAGTPSTIETITDEQVAEVVSGGSPQGNEMLDLSGLSSLWSKGAPASLAPSATIAPGTDLDTITTVGSYACSDASGVTNTPEGVTGAFNLYVYETQGGGLVHELHCGAVVWRRSHDGAWGAWFKSHASDGPLPVTDGGTGAVDVAGALASLGLTSIEGNAPYVKAGRSTTKAVFGSVVKTVSSMYVQCLSGAEVRSLIGRDPVWDGGDFAVVVNGAEEATTNHVSTVLNNQTNAIDLRVRNETGGEPTKGSMRLNYLIFAR